MKQHDIEIEIGRDGKLKATVRGAKGKGCVKYMDLLREIVGKISTQEFSSEYYEPDEEVEIKPTVSSGQGS